MSKHTLTTTSDDGLKAETRDVSHELLKALDAFAGMTERAAQELSEMDAEEVLGKADADAWFLQVLTHATDTILPIRAVGNTSFAAARAKRFNVNLKKYQQDLDERLAIANKKVATLRQDSNKVKASKP